MRTAIPLLMKYTFVGLFRLAAEREATMHNNTFKIDAKCIMSLLSNMNEALIIDSMAITYGPDLREKELTVSYTNGHFHTYCLRDTLDTMRRATADYMHEVVSCDAPDDYELIEE
jgi:hypothetical protein